jgi:enoyl reductase-like protein
VQFFIDVVDAKLLKVILFEVFKSKNVKQSNSLGAVGKVFVINLLWLNRYVHSLDQPVEQVVVDLLSQSVPIIAAFLMAVGRPNILAWQFQAVLKKYLK